MKIGFKTDKGRERTHNEDAFFVMQKDNVFIVADGVGGSRSGEIASRTAVNKVAEKVEKTDISSLTRAIDIERFFFDSFQYANGQIIEMSDKFIENRGMATTLVLAYVKECDLYVMNVGDSRGYIFSDGELTQLTEDHTYVNQLVKGGIITKEEAEQHEDSHKITRAIGADSKLVPDFFHNKVKVGDKILLCTDGLYGEVDHRDLVMLMEIHKDMSELSQALIDMANFNGGHDNITVICIEITEDDINE